MKRLQLPERLKQALRDPGPAPALHRGASRSGAELAPALRGEPEDGLELRAQVLRVGRGEARERLEVAWVRILQPGGDLGEARVPRDEGRAAGGRGLRGDHAEGLGEDRGDDGD